MDQDIEDILRRYRSGDVDLAQLRAWLSMEASRVAIQLKRGALLRLRHGADSTAMAAVAQLLPACIQCVSVGVPKQFVSRDEYRSYSQCRDAVVAAKVLIEIAQPPWGEELPATAGSAMHCRCSQCGSMWAFIEPEREYNGSWNRIA